MVIRKTLSWILVIALVTLTVACNGDKEKTVYPHGTPGVYVSLLDPDEMPGEDMVYADEDITFYIHVSDENATAGIEQLYLAFRVYSPDDISWTTTEALATSKVDKLSPAMTVTGFPGLGSGADTIMFEGINETGGALPEDFADTVMSVTIGPIDACYYQGKQICIDNCDFPDGRTWSY